MFLLLQLSNIQPTTPKDNLALGKTVFIADVIFDSALLIWDEELNRVFWGDLLPSRISAARLLSKYHVSSISCISIAAQHMKWSMLLYMLLMLTIFTNYTISAIMWIANFRMFKLALAK